MKTNRLMQNYYQSVVLALATNVVCKRWKTLVLFIMTSLAVMSQNHAGSIKVNVRDSLSSKEPIPFANVIVYKGKIQVAAGTTDLDGNVMIKPLTPGLYNLKVVYVGYNPKQINKVEVLSDKTVYLSILLSNDGIRLDEVMITDYAVDLIDKDTKSGGIIERENFQHMASKDLNSVISTQAGVILTSNGSSTSIQVRGSRVGNRNVFIDGERSVGNYNARTVSNSTTEEYGVFKENVFNGVSNQPLSTFAIDVDAASYSNTRRMLNQGMLPSKEAIRIEEFINYFKYNYPRAKDNIPFSISTEYAACPWNKAHQLLQIGIKGKELDANVSVPNNLIFLIDVSGSMSDANKLPLLKRAFKLLVKQLRAEDKLSIVVYAGSSGVVLNAVSGDDKEKINDALDQLNAGGSTAGGEGINLAYKIAEKHFIKNGNNRVILATDGDFNVGVSGEEELKALIEEKRTHGIYLSVLGFGEGNIKDNKMETLADKGNGNYYYIDNFMEARKVLVSQFGGTMYTIAKDVKIQVEFNPAKVKEYRLIGYDNRLLNAEDFNNDRKDAGELGAGHCVTALYEIIPAGSTDSQTKIDELKYTKSSVNGNNNEIATVKFRYKGVKQHDTTSKLIQEVVQDASLRPEQTSANFKLAAGVTEFAMLLRGSEYMGISNFEEAIELVSLAKENDPDGYIAGLIEMIHQAKELMPADLTKK